MSASEARTTFKIYAVDPATSQVAYYGVIEEMLTAAAAIEHGKGELAPFADDCERHENGGQTTHNKTPIPWPVDLGSPEANRSMAIIGTLSCTAQNR